MIRFANTVRALPDDEHAALVRHWQGRIESEDASRDAALMLALALGQPGRATANDLAQARRLLTGYLASATDLPAWKRRLAEHQLAMLGGARGYGEDVGRVVRIALGIGELSAAEWRQRVQDLDDALASGAASTDSNLELALLLGSSRSGHAQNLTRASRLLEAYLADAGDADPTLRDFAAYHLHLFRKRQQQLRLAIKEKGNRKELERKLEALKAIELRMTNEDRGPVVPLQ